MPGKNFPFTTRVEPISPPYQPDSKEIQLALVEAPGTAPGSATPIPESVYHHSRQADISYIAFLGSNLKDQSLLAACQRNLCRPNPPPTRGPNGRI